MEFMLIYAGFFSREDSCIGPKIYKNLWSSWLFSVPSSSNLASTDYFPSLTIAQLCLLAAVRSWRRFDSWAVDVSGVCSHLIICQTLITVDQRPSTAVVSQHNDSNEMHSPISLSMCWRTALHYHHHKRCITRGCRSGWVSMYPLLVMAKA